MVVKKTNEPSKKPVGPVTKKYSKIGILAAIVLVVAGLGIWGISALNNRVLSVEKSLSDVSREAVDGASLRIAVVRMDAVLSDSKVLKSLRAEKDSWESKLRDELSKEQKALEKEKAEIERSQSLLSHDALQRRVADYQKRVADLQRGLSEKSQAIDNSYQKALANIQEKHLSPLIEGIIAKKNLSLVIDGRFARMGANIPNLDITNDVINALDKRISNTKMEIPKGL